MQLKEDKFVYLGLLTYVIWCDENDTNNYHDSHLLTAKELFMLDPLLISDDSCTDNCS